MDKDKASILEVGNKFGGKCINQQYTNWVQAKVRETGMNGVFYNNNVCPKWYTELGGEQLEAKVNYIIGNKLIIDKRFVELSSIPKKYYGRCKTYDLGEKVYIVGCIAALLRTGFGLGIEEVYMCLMNNWDDYAHDFKGKGYTKELNSINAVLYKDIYNIDWDIEKLGIGGIKEVSSRLQNSNRDTSCYINQTVVEDKVYIGLSPKRIVRENFVEKKAKRHGIVGKVTNYYLGELEEVWPKLARGARVVEVDF